MVAHNINCNCLMNESNDPLAAAPEILKQSIRRDASWFFWICGLSIINTVVNLTGGDMQFVIGLGVCQILDAIRMVYIEEGGASTGIPAIILIIMTIGVSVIFGLFGLAGIKRLRVIYIFGLVFYLLDGLLFLLFGDFLSFGFHLFALFFLIRALKWMSEYRKLEGIIAAGGLDLEPEMLANEENERLEMD